MGKGNCDSNRLKTTLHAYYESNGIAVKGFKCPHWSECEKFGPLPGRGSEAHIGSSYGDPIRIAVVSLDRGDGAEDVWSRSSEVENSPEKGLNRHMAGTLCTLKAILCERGSANLWTQFAMINAAKCCNGSKNSVPDQLYEECSEFGFQELILLKPQIVIAQGKNAKRPLKSLCPIDEVQASNIANRYLSGLSQQELVHSIRWMVEKYLYKINLGDACWCLATPHPSDRGGRWPAFSNLALPILGRILHDLVIRQPSSAREAMFGCASILRPAASI